MDSRPVASILFGVAAVAAAIFFFGTYSQLPVQVVTRFSSDGQALQTVSKGAFALLYWGLLVLCVVYFLGMLLRPLPERYQRFIPNHTHWLLPQHRDASLRYVSALLTWLALATLLVFMGNLVLLALLNVGRGFPGISTILSLLDTIYLSCVFFMVIAFRGRFAKPRE